MTRQSEAAAFGEQLRQERERHGRSVDSICNATKVSSRHIQALEEGHLDQLPGGVFRRGFVRSYLAALDLEQDSWMKRFDESCRNSGIADPAEPEWARFAENVKNGRGQIRRRTGWRWLGIGVLFLLTVLAGWCGWRLATHRKVLSSAPVWHRLKSWVDNQTSR